MVTKSVFAVRVEVEPWGSTKYASSRGGGVVQVTMALASMSLASAGEMEVEKNLLQNTLVKLMKTSAL